MGAGPVFVVGSPRSGTTAVGLALGRHPHLWAGRESKFLAELISTGALAHVLRQEEGRPDGFFNTHGIDADILYRSVGRGLSDLFRHASGGQRWVDHAPRNTAVLPELARLFPDARFVHVLRDGRAVVASMLALHRVDRPDIELVGRDFGSSCERWCTRVRQARVFGAAHPDRYLEVRNELLEADPGAVADDILTFLGLDPDSGPSELLAGPRVNSSYVSGHPPDDPWTGFSADERASFREIAGDLLVELGYARPADLVR